MTAVTKIEKYASAPPKLLLKAVAPNWQSFDGQKLYKYAKYSKVYENSTKAVQWLLDTCPNKNERKRTVVDVKLVHLEKGQNPCMPFWHTDCTMDMSHNTRPEIHYIYVVGAGSRTKFLWEPLDVTPDFENSIEEHMCELIPEETWVSYGREHLHKCSPAERSGFRLLIRVTETDLIPYQNKPRGVFSIAKHAKTAIASQEVASI